MFNKKFWIPFFIIGIIGTLMHFIYEWSGENPVVGLFAPINESIWEHQKLLFFPSIAYSAFSYLKDRKYPNDPISTLFGVISGMLSIITLYYTYKGIIGKDIGWLNIVIFYIGVAVFLITKRIIRKNRVLTGITPNIAAIIIILILSILFGIWTYMPPKLGIFTPPMA
ncbi:MAG: hypothetical protein E7562_00015 [Ruminococcaceae bacterium]|nr:hypothetical protein [Oscillospiraceae bacterium]